MERQAVIVMAWELGLMVSPEALLLHGNITGLSGIYLIIPIALGIGLHWLNIVNSATNDEVGLLTSSIGSFGATIVLLLARPAMAVCLATATLVTSGFVFNETFIQWFPNFGFTVLLLVVVTVINLAGRRIVTLFQMVTVLTAVCGLLCLILLGLINWGAAATESLSRPPAFGRASILLGILPFIGYELFAHTPHGAEAAERGGMRGYTIWGLLFAGALFLSWDLIMLRFVSAGRLADSYIPHILAARAIAGQTGRYIIGITAIAGSMAAVNVLFQAISRMAATMADQRLLPAVFSKPADRPILPLVILSGMSGGAMAMGFAGSEYLDVAIRAGLILWLVVYASIQLARLLAVFRVPQRIQQKSWFRSGRLSHLLLMAGFFLIAVILTLDYQQPAAMLKCIGVMAGSAVAAALVIKFWLNFRPLQPKI